MLHYAITDRRGLGLDEASRRAALVDQVRQLVERGADFLQLREKDLPVGALVSLARDLLSARQAATPASGTGPRLLVSGRADVAIAAGAEGVHLTAGPNELTPSQVRRLYSDAGLPSPTVSVSCHTVADVRRAAEAGNTGGPDLILFGPVFEKVVAERRMRGAGVQQLQVAEGCGLDLLGAACRVASPVPVLALGGVTPENMGACVAAGAAGVAAIRMFLV